MVMMVMIVTSMYLLYKNQGQTCGEVLSKLRTALSRGDVEVRTRRISLSGVSHAYDEHTPDDISVLPPMTYVGRLDPLAEGVLIILEGEEIAHKHLYQDLDKTYECEVVCGVATDSYDQLGCIFPPQSVMTWPTYAHTIDSAILSAEVMRKNCTAITAQLQSMIGELTMYYPFFSSKPIDGVPLFQYTKDHGVEHTQTMLPHTCVQVRSIECTEVTEMSLEHIGAEAISLAETQKGDFRQTDIIASWKSYINGYRDTAPMLPVLRFRITCGSGFYVRTFACWIGQMLGTGAIARRIVRTACGAYTDSDPQIIRFD
jgi:tRNA pseudouridine(55) synthase